MFRDPRGVRQYASNYWVVWCIFIVRGLHDMSTRLKLSPVLAICVIPTALRWISSMMQRAVRDASWAGSNELPLKKMMSKAEWFRQRIDRVRDSHVCQTTEWTDQWDPRLNEQSRCKLCYGEIITLRNVPASQFLVSGHSTYGSRMAPVGD